MAKRLLRISPSDFPEKLPALLHAELNVVGRQGWVLHGYLSHYHSDTIQLRNSLGKERLVLLSEVAEVVLAVPATF